MTTKLSPQPKLILPSSGSTKKRIVTYAFDTVLEVGEVITAASASCSGLTISSVTISSAAMTVDGVSVPAGQVVSFFVAGQVVDTDYTVLIDVTTDAGQDIEDQPCPLRCKAN